jgi:DNA uptake protein ComE-like DNA-binding protein
MRRNDGPPVPFKWGCVATAEANVEELETLPGVGPARAELIIQHRPYRSVDELFQKHALPRSVVDNDRELLKTSGKSKRALKRNN